MSSGRADRWLVEKPPRPAFIVGMSTMPSASQPRQPAGIPVGGQWAVRRAAESPQTLDAAAPVAPRVAEMQQRHRVLEQMGFVPARAVRAEDDPRSTARRAEWWETHFVNAEYGPANRIGGQTGYAQMPDDNTPEMTGGRALSGHRRTHRVKYEGSGLALRMPSATAIKRFEKQSGGQTFDVPVSAVNDDTGGSISGWVRVTRSGDDWHTEGLGFPASAQDQVAEAVSAVLEARRPTQALSQVGDLIARHKAKRASYGVEVEPVRSAWIDGAGYDEDSGTMVMETASQRSYGFAVPKAAFTRMMSSSAPGRVFNAEIKGVAQRVEVQSCGRCGRFYQDGRAHTCPPSHRPAPTVSPLHSRRARIAAMRATARYGRSLDTPAD